MRILTVVWVLLRDHVRRGGALIELIVGMLIAGIALSGQRGLYQASYVAMVIPMVASVLPALSASLLVARAADLRGEMLVLRVGRLRYYLAVVAAGVLSGAFWMAVFSAAVFLKGVEPAPAGTWLVVFGAALQNAALVVAVICLFSALCGRPVELVVAAVVIILGLNSSWVQELGLVALNRLELLMPPLMDNVKAATGQRGPVTVRSMVYLAALLGLGLLRFHRREFYRT